MKKIGFLFFVVLLLSSCVSKIPPNTIRVYDANAYAMAKPLLRYDFIQQKINAEIIQSSNSLNLAGGLAGNKAAKNLYEKLSISFRFPESDFSSQLMLLKDYVSNDAKLTMHSYGFTIDQGLEFITVTILGETDWDHNNVSDYLISFRIKQDSLRYKLNNKQTSVALPTREYILLVEDVSSRVYIANILFIRDYIKDSTGVRTQIYKDHEGAEDSFFQEHGAISFEQGQEQIVFAPNADKKQKIKPKQNEEVKQRKLSE